MDRQEIEQSIRAVTRTCKGPHVLSSEQQVKFRDLWYVCQDAGDWHAAQSIVGVLERFLGTGHMAIPEQDWEALYRRAVDLIYIRKMTINPEAGCGYDFNEIILANPLDGQDRIVPCPKCGNQISYKAPTFEE
jgi:hypothetical protein